MTDSNNVYSVEAPARTPNILPREAWGLDFDVVAKKEDVDLLRDAVLEILKSLSDPNDPFVKRHFGPACDKLLEEWEAKPKQLAMEAKKP